MKKYRILIVSVLAVAVLLAGFFIMIFSRNRVPNEGVAINIAQNAIVSKHSNFDFSYFNVTATQNDNKWTVVFSPKEYVAGGRSVVIINRDTARIEKLEIHK